MKKKDYWENKRKRTSQAYVVHRDHMVGKGLVGAEKEPSVPGEERGCGWHAPGRTWRIPGYSDLKQRI